MRAPIPDDAERVAYFRPFNNSNPPLLVMVERRTKTTVKLVGFDTLFRKSDGMAKGEQYSGSLTRIEPVTPAILDWLAAVEMHAELKAAHDELEREVYELGDSSKYARSTAAVRTNINAVKAALAALAALSNCSKEPDFDAPTGVPDGSKGADNG